MRRNSILCMVVVLFLLLTPALTTRVQASAEDLRGFSAPVDGNWTGTTSLGKTVTFSTQSSGTQWSTFALGTAFNTSGCSSASVTMTLTVPGPGSITGNAFSYTNGSTYTFSGVFDTPYTAHGTYAFINYKVFIYSGCYYYLYQSGTWTASTPMPPPGAFSKTAPADGANSQLVNPILSWGASANATDYEYCYSTTNPCDNWQSSISETTVTLNGLDQNTTYYWNVRAVNTSDTVYADGSTTNWSFTTGVLPGAFSKTAPSDNATDQPITLNLEWEPSSGLLNYEYCISTSSPCDGWQTNNTATTVALNDLDPETTYYWNVRSINSIGTTYSNASTVDWSFTTGILPGTFNKTGPADGASNQPLTLDLTWETSDPVFGYEYCYSTTNPCTSYIPNGTSNQATLIGLLEYTTYYWNVRDRNSIGTTYANGSTTNWSFTTGGKPGVFNMVSPVNGSINRPANLTLKWAPSANTTTYFYCYDKSNDGACGPWVNNGTATSKAITGLLPNTTYYWRVKAVNSFGTTYSNGALTTFWSFKTGSKPGAFGKIAPTNGALNQLLNPTLKWGASARVVYYQYCISKTNPCSKWIKIGNVTSKALSGLLGKTKYYWQVRAVNTFGTTYANGTTADWLFTTK
jgi:hypothetical protein